MQPVKSKTEKYRIAMSLLKSLADEMSDCGAALFEMLDSSPVVVSKNPQCDGVQNDEGQPEQNLELCPSLDQLLCDPTQNLDLLQMPPISVEINGQEYSVSFVNYSDVIPVSAIVDVEQSEQMLQEIAEREISSNDVSISAEPEPGEITTLTRGRKRSRNTAEWKANKRQRLRQSGKQYTSIRGKLVDERTVKAHKSKCRFQCSENFSDADRQVIHDDFWKLNDDEKRHYFARSTEKVDKARTRLGRNKRTLKVRNKQYSFRYYLELQGKQRVCKSFYLSMLDISQT